MFKIVGAQYAGEIQRVIKGLYGYSRSVVLLARWGEARGI